MFCVSVHSLSLCGKGTRDICCTRKYCRGNQKKRQPHNECDRWFLFACIAAMQDTSAIFRLKPNTM
jgi:hypothetical protein